ncbi:hypothetical protein [Spirosoma sp.]|uniref:hypothetical protein n=1 Tax=Spirosoma sp. TaxID=1899569 RepID=UPI003B3AEBD9
MHHIDRTLQELETGSGVNGEYETGYEFSVNGEYGQAFEQSFGQEANYENDETFELEQDPELEMAYQLLEVSNEYELNQFLGGLMSKALGAAKSAATGFINSPTGKGVGQYLVNFGKQTLPQLATQYGGLAGGALGQRAGAALGGRLGPLGSKAGGWLGQQAGSWAGGKAGNWAGTQAGNVIASNAQRIFNLEFEALQPEDQELEIARSFVRFASDLTRQAHQSVRQNPALSLGAIGKQAITASARQYAPGLLANSRRSALKNRPGKAGGGTWVRRGNTLLIYGT